jgi:putative flippase GtrA
MHLLRHKLVRFAIVGGGSTLSYVLLYTLLRAWGVDQALANAGAFFIAVIVQYAGHSLFTFRKPPADAAQIIRFVVMIGLGFASSAVITGPLASATGLAPLIAAAIVAVALPVQNYVFMTLWVFASPFSKTEIRP